MAFETPFVPRGLNFSFGPLGVNQLIIKLSYLLKLFYMRPFRPASSSSDQLVKTILMVATAARLMARFFIVVQHLICKANVSMRG